MSDLEKEPSSKAHRALREFARSHRLRVQPCLEVFLDPADPAFVRVGVTCEGRKLFVLASAMRLVLSTKARMPVFFSVGAPDQVLITTEAVKNRWVGIPQVYVRAGFDEAVRTWLNLPHHAKALKELKLGRKESAHIARNSVMLVLDQNRAIDESIQAIVAFVETVSESKPTSREPARLPVGFEDLEPLARTWAIAADDERESAIAAASAGERAELKRMILPRLDDIDRYFDDRDPTTPLASDALRLQVIGELGAELKAETKK